MAAATAIVTVASVSAVSVSLAYQLTRVMIYKVVEGAANACITILAKTSESPGRVQFILMELDVEAKFKTVRSLLQSVEGEELDLPETSKDFVHVCVNNVRDVMATVSITLTRIQNTMDAHAQMWFNGWRRLDVVDDLELLKAQCRMFDKRLETLIQCLSVPSKARPEATIAAQNGLVSQLIYGESETEEIAEELERARAHLMAAQALEDANIHGAAAGGVSASAAAPSLAKSRTTTTATTPTTTVLFEDPVFL